MSRWVGACLALLALWGGPLSLGGWGAPGPVWSGAALAGEAQALAADPVVEQRLIAIAEELRCLVCQNESLAASRAELAIDLRREIRGLIRAGKSDEDIMNFMVARYGDFVRYRPPLKPATLALWIGPFVLLLVGMVVLVRHVRRARGAGAAGGPGGSGGIPALSEAERARAAALLEDA